MNVALAEPGWGEVEVAVLSDGRMIEEPKPLFSNGEGSALNGNRMKMGVAYLQLPATAVWA